MFLYSLHMAILLIPLPQLNLFKSSKKRLFLEQILSPLLRKGFLGTLLITQNYTMQENITLRHQYHL